MEGEQAQNEKKVPVAGGHFWCGWWRWGFGSVALAGAVEAEVLKREQVNKALLLLECGAEYGIHLAPR